MNAQEIIAKADRGEGLTEASVRKVWFSCKEVS